MCEVIPLWTIRPPLWQHNQVASICLQKRHNTTQKYWLINCTNCDGWAQSFSLLHADDVSSETQPFLSCPFRLWVIAYCTWPYCIPLPEIQEGPVWNPVLPLVKVWPVSPIRKQMSQSEPWRSSLVFIFIFYIRLNVQRVSCSVVKYLYIINTYEAISWFYLNPLMFLFKLSINHWMQKDKLCFFFKLN